MSCSLIDSNYRILSVHFFTSPPSAWSAMFLFASVYLVFHKFSFFQLCVAIIPMCHYIILAWWKGKRECESNKSHDRYPALPRLLTQAL